MESVKSQLEKSIFILQTYIEKEDYSGFDPYDGLKSPIFNLPILKSIRTIRFWWQQSIKRLPFNIRPALGINKGKNPVTLGLCIQAYSYLIEVFPENKESTLIKINELLDELENLSSNEFSGNCWGYDFDWEARYASIPANRPTVVATGIIVNALFECWKITRDKRCAEMIKSAAIFVLKDLNRVKNDELKNINKIGNFDTSFCFSYSPFDYQKVLNASMKGVRILAQSYFIEKDESFKKIAKNAVQFVIDKQQENGSFSYSDKREKIDNYHTAYILDCLDEFQKCFQTDEFDSYLQKGFDFYLNSFFTDKGIPKFYNNSIFPIDCTAAGQSILSLTRFNELKLASRVSSFMIENMQDPIGFFYFRKYKSRINKTSFMRWSNAWMLVGMTFLLKVKLQQDQYKS